MTPFTIPTIYTAIDKASGPFQRMAQRMVSAGDAIEKKYKAIADVANDLSFKAAAAGAAIIAPLTFGVTQFAKYEDKLIDVGKTTGMTGDVLSKFGDDMMKYTRETRTGIGDILAIATVGGSLGVASNQLDEFTKSADKFNIALGSDFGSVEEAIRTIASSRNLFAETRGLEAGDQITKLGSAINELTNVGAKASELANFVNRIGALPDALKPSIQITTALGAVFDKSGISAEIASSGFQNLISLGGRDMPQFAKQMKLSTIEATKLFNTDPAKFAIEFSKSFAGLKADQITQQLYKMGVRSNEVIKTVGALGSNYGLFLEYQDLANKAFKDGTSLAEEAARKNANLAARWEILKNKGMELSIRIGESLLPAVDKIIDKVGPVITATSDWVRENKELSKGILTTVAVVGGLLLMFGSLLKVIALIIEAKKTWTMVQLALDAAMWANPIGLIILAIIALIALVILIIYYWEEWGKTVALFTGQVGALAEMIQTLRRNWDMITKAFNDGGIIAGLIAINRTFNEMILAPVQRLTELLGDLPLIGGIFKESARGIQIMRENNGAVMSNVDSDNPIEKINPGNMFETVVQRSFSEMVKENRLKLEIVSPNANVNVIENDSGIPIQMPSSVKSPW
ncbi:MAG: phage tail tape measure protein [Taibaiella sp.]|nr:phage tail tape measure protein [Taibaiella sp.]